MDIEAVDSDDEIVGTIDKLVDIEDTLFTAMDFTGMLLELFCEIFTYEVILDTEEGLLFWTTEVYFADRYLTCQYVVHKH